MAQKGRDTTRSSSRPQAEGRSAKPDPFLHRVPRPPSGAARSAARRDLEPTSYMYGRRRTTERITVRGRGGKYNTQNTRAVDLTSHVKLSHFPIESPRSLSLSAFVPVRREYRTVRYRARMKSRSGVKVYRLISPAACPGRRARGPSEISFLLMLIKCNHTVISVITD